MSLYTLTILDLMNHKFKPLIDGRKLWIDDIDMFIDDDEAENLASFCESYLSSYTRRAATNGDSHR